MMSEKGSCSVFLPEISCSLTSTCRWGEKGESTLMLAVYISSTSALMPYLSSSCTRVSAMPEGKQVSQRSMKYCLCCSSFLAIDNFSLHGSYHFLFIRHLLGDGLKLLWLSKVNPMFNSIQKNKYLVIFL